MFGISNNMTVKNKIIGAILFVSLILTFASFIFIVLNQESRLKEDQEDNIRLYTKMLGEFSVPALSYEDRETAQKILTKLINIPYITQAYIYDENQLLFTSFIKDSLNFDTRIYDNERFKDTIFYQGNISSVISPIKLNNEVKGYVQIVSDGTYIKSKINSYIIFIVLLSIVIIFISYFLATIISKPLSAPLVKLKNLTERITEDESYDVKIDDIPNDDFGKIFISFNKMVEELKNRKISQIAAENKLSKLADDLEETITRRTILLEAAVEQLKVEIEEREKTSQELLKAKNELQEALKSEKELNEMKSRFISMVSHEYRTPLTVILSSVSLMTKSCVPTKHDTFNKHYNRIQSSVDRMLSMLNDVLMMGKLEGSKNEFSPVELDLVELIFDIIEERKAADESSHQIIFNCNYSNLYILADKSALYHIFSNLISNACKFSKAESPVELNIETSNNGFKFKVKDYGMGISPELHDKIYEPFRRGINVVDISGTGLGLSIVKRIIEKLSGTIKYDSMPGKYTEFEIYLPMICNTNKITEIPSSENDTVMDYIN